MKNLRKRVSVLIILIMSMILVVGCNANITVDLDKDKSTIKVTGITTKDSKDNQNKANNKNDENNVNDVAINNPSGELIVHFIDVGQADSILLEQNKEYMLIDAGNNGDSELVVDYLENQDIEELKYVIGTHPHEDHIGGLDKVIENFEVDKIIMPKKTATTKTYKDVINAIKTKNMSITSPVVGDKYTLGDASITICGPVKDNYKGANNHSVVIRVVFGDTSFLFTGDAEEDSEQDMLEADLNLQVDVLKVGHHGSHSSSSLSFINAVNPTYAVISVGLDNDYGHPHKETIDLFKEKGIETYRTDESGNIICTSDGQTIKFNK